MAERNEEYKNLLKLQEMDRKRIANELHDTSLQTLAHLTHQVELASLYMDKDIVKAKLELADVNNHIRNIIEEIRNTIFDLRPMTFDDIGLKEAIEREISNINARSETKFTTDIQDVDSCDDFILLEIYRIVQECVKNCEKHSQASNVSVKIYSDDAVHIIIEDDGVGMDVKNIPGVDENHFGYTILCDRVAAVGGEMKLDSSLNKGTRITFKIPIC